MRRISGVGRRTEEREKGVPKRSPSRLVVRLLSACCSCGYLRLCLQCYRVTAGSDRHAASASASASALNLVLVPASARFCFCSGIPRRPWWLLLCRIREEQVLRVLI